MRQITAWLTNVLRRALTRSDPCLYAMLHGRYLRTIGCFSIRACKAETRHFGCSLAVSSKLTFGTNSLARKGRLTAHRRFRAATEYMAKVDDPSQAFHSGQAKARSALDETSNGEFKRTDSTYREHIKHGTRFEPEGVSLRHTWHMLILILVSNAVQACLLIPVSYASCHHCSFAVFTPRSVVIAAGRYHLYIAYACPWASRCLAVRNLKVSRCILSCVLHAILFPTGNITMV